MQQIGPYRLNRPLGEGGMGIVWRAVHVDGGAPVALKTVRLLHARQLDGIRREIRALSRIEHPGIVRIVDQGVHLGAPWYAMRLLDGPSLRQCGHALTASATTRFLLSNFNPVTPHTTVNLDDEPLSLEEWDDTQEAPPPVRPVVDEERLHTVMSLIRRLCSPLGFLHGEGIVHRDLKPDNVVVLEDGRPVLVDFGLVSHGVAGRETLTVDAVLHGTVSYMAPEQIRGELVDARSDLYALGCILYELVTGRLPFRSTSVGAALYQHLQRSPMPPSHRVDGVPEGLEALILSLLEKRPEDRPGYAIDVAAALEALGASNPDDPGPTPRPYLYRPRFAGRAAALDTLKTRLDTRRGVVLLGGESGVGKTRLALEFARQVAMLGKSVLIGECEPADAESGQAHGGPFYPLRPALLAVGDRCMQDGATTTQQVLGERGRVLARYQPSLLEIPGVLEHEEPARLEPDAERLRVMRWLSLTLAAHGGDGGSVLFLDDLQWADQLTLEWLVHVARSEPPDLVVVCTYRKDHQVPPSLRAVIEQPGITQLSIERLDHADVRAMTADMLALQTVPSGLVDFLADSSGGNPFLLAEYLRSTVVEGVLQRREFQWTLGTATGAETWSSLPVPPRVHELILARVDGLSPVAAAVVAAAAVAGREILPEVVARMSVEDGDDGGAAWLDAVSELLDRAILEEQDDRLHFVHDQVREVIYEAQPAHRREELHGHAAQALVASGQDDDPGAVAHHWLRAGNDERARHWYLRGARAAVGQHAHRDAERLYRAYLKLVEEDTVESVRARIEFGSAVLGAQGRNPEALGILERARELASPLEDPELQADILAALGRVTSTVGRLQDSLDFYRTELALRKEYASPLHGQALARVAEGLEATGHHEDAQRAYRDALGLALQDGNALLAARARMGVAGVLPEERRSEARELVEEALAGFRTVGDRAMEAAALNRMANLQDGEKALALYQQALNTWRLVGDRLHAAMVLANIAIHQHALGQLAESHANYAEALEIFRETGHHRFQGHALHFIGVHLRREGRLSESEGLNRQALTLLLVVGDRRWVNRVRCELAGIALRRGKLDRAITHATRAISGARNVQQGPCELESLHIKAVALEQQGELPAARAVHHEAAARATTLAHRRANTRAQVWLARLDRLEGGASDELDTRLSDLIHQLDDPKASDTLAIAWAERGWLALSMGQCAQTAWNHARDAHHASLHLEPLVARHIQALDAARSEA